MSAPVGTLSPYLFSACTILQNCALEPGVLTRLKATAAGRFLDVRAATPRFHGDGRADWNFLVTITYRDWAALEAHSEADIAARLFPDQARYRAEERRRFELLEAHWDVSLEDHVLPDR